MHKPQRNSDSVMFSNLETDIIALSATAMGIADGGSITTPKTVITNATPQPEANAASFYAHGLTLGSNASPYSFAIGVLLEDNMLYDQNYLAKCAGFFHIVIDDQMDYEMIGAVVGKVADTHADVHDAEDLIGFEHLPLTHYHKMVDTTNDKTEMVASVNCTTLMGNWNSALSAYSNQPIFFGWLVMINISSVALTAHIRGSMSAQVLYQGLKLNDPFKQ